MNISIKRVCSDRIPAVTNSVASIVKKTTLLVALRRLWQLIVVGCPGSGAEEYLSLVLGRVQVAGRDDTGPRTHLWVAKCLFT